MTILHASLNKSVEKYQNSCRHMSFVFMRKHHLYSISRFFSGRTSFCQRVSDSALDVKQNDPTTVQGKKPAMDISRCILGRREFLGYT